MSFNYNKEIINLGNRKAYVFIGYSITNDQTFRVINTSQTINSINCFSIIYLANIRPGKNIRMDMWTAEDPYIFVDQKFFDVRPLAYLENWEKYYTPPTNSNVKLFEHHKNFTNSSLYQTVFNTIPTSNILRKRDVSLVNPTYYIKKLTSNGSLVIYANNKSYWFGTNEKDNGVTQNINPDDFLEIFYNESFIDSNSNFYNEKTNTQFSFIAKVENETKRKGRTYILRDFEPGRNIAIYQSNKWINLRDGLQEEDLSDLLPEGVLQISVLKECLSSYKIKNTCLNVIKNNNLNNAIQSCYKINKVTVQKHKDSVVPFKVYFVYKNNNNEDVTLVFDFPDTNLSKSFEHSYISNAKCQNFFNYNLYVELNNQTYTTVQFYAKTTNSIIYTFGNENYKNFIFIFFEKCQC